jgi:hypothetical protein
VAYWRVAQLGDWVEMEFGTHPELKAPLAQLKLKLEHGRLGKGELSRAMVALAAGPAHELSRQDLAVLPVLPPPPAVPSTLHATSRSSHVRLMTRMGTIPAVLWEIATGDTVLQRAWFSQAVPVLRLAKLEVPGVVTLEAEDWGAQAQPRIAMPGGPAAPLEQQLRGDDDGTLPAP